MYLIANNIDIDKLQAIGKMIVILADALPDFYEHIITPDNVGGRKSVSGRVFSVGSKVQECKFGDRLLFTRMHGREINYEGEKIYFIHESQVYAKISDDVKAEIKFEPI